MSSDKEGLGTFLVEVATLRLANDLILSQSPPKVYNAVGCCLNEFKGMPVLMAHQYLYLSHCQVLLRELVLLELVKQFGCKNRQITPFGVGMSALISYWTLSTSNNDINLR